MRQPGRPGSAPVRNVTQAFSFLRVSLPSGCVGYLARRRPLVGPMRQQVRRTAAGVNWITLWDSSWRIKCHWSPSQGGFYLDGPGEEVQGRCVEIDAAVELIKKLH